MSNNKDFKVKNSIQPTVYQEGLGTVVSGSVGYNIAGAVYDSVSFSVAPQDGIPYNFQWKPDGTKFYVVGFSSDAVYQYSCSTSYDISTASYDSVSFSVSSQATAPYDIHFKTDGTKMYISDGTTDTIYQYSLPTAWDISTASYDSVSFSVSSQDTAPIGLTFGSSGTKMYIGGNTTDTVYQYTLSTAWDLSTAGYDSKSLSVSSQDSFPSGLHFKPNGLTLYVFGGNNNAVYQYSLTTAWDISTASYDSISFSFLSQDNQAYGGTFNTDGTKMYMIGVTSDTIYQYSPVLTSNTLDLSTGSVFEITPTSDIQVALSNPASSGTSSGATLLLSGGGTTGYDLGNGFYQDLSYNVNTQEANPYGIRFNASGDKLYVVGGTTNAVLQYSLSSSYEINTASYDSVSFSFTGQEATPEDFTFNNDGTKMYMVGRTSDSVYQYSLSTAFDISTMSYNSVSLSVSAQDTYPIGIRFNSDGTKMYILGYTGLSVYQYSLSTAFDLSTASYDSVSFSVSSQDSVPISLAFNNLGTKMYVLGNTNNSVYQYSLSTAFNLSTASYDSVSFSVSSQDASTQAIEFNSSGTKMYIAGSVGDTIYQYSTATPATITYPSTLKWPSGTAPTSPAIGDTDVITFNTIDGGTTYKSVLAIDGAS